MSARLIPHAAPETASESATAAHQTCHLLARSVHPLWENRQGQMSLNATLKLETPGEEEREEKLALEKMEIFRVKPFIFGQ